MKSIINYELRITNYKKNKGFTLIELIVAITIIAVVTMVTVVSFAGTNKRARDSRRMADLEKLRVALEMAKQIGVTYPATLGVLVTGNYIQSIPADPKTNIVYPYEMGATNYIYSLYAVMEDMGNTTGDYTGDYNYRVSSP